MNVNHQSPRQAVLKFVILIITIATLTIVSEDQWGYLECMYKACQAARNGGGFSHALGR